MEQLLWIVAIRTDDGEWKSKYFGNGSRPRLFRDDGSIHPIIDECPAYIRDRSEFGIFYNRPGWQDRRPRYYFDMRQTQSEPRITAGLAGLFNSLQSDWF